MGIGIVGLGHAVPENVMTNQDLEKLVDTSNDWIVTRTGIKERRIAPKGSGTSTWAVQAAKKALKKAQMTADQIDLIVMGTTTPDMPLPSCACLVQKELGANRAVAFDVSAACAGFLYALSIGEQFLKSDTHKNALIIGADQISSYIDWKDRTTCILFGDAAGACVLKKVSSPGIVDIDLGSDGNFSDLITIPGGGSKSHVSSSTMDQKMHYLKMNGQEVFKQAVRGMVQSVSSIIDRNNVSMDDIKCIIPHQANVRIIEAVSSRLKFDKEKIVVNLDRYGNTSAASVVLALSEAVENGVVKKDDLIILTTFGAGLVWGSALIRWN